MTPRCEKCKCWMYRERWNLLEIDVYRCGNPQCRHVDRHTLPEPDYYYEDEP